MKKWAAVDADGFVVHGFDADQELVDNFEERIVESEGVTTPYWWTPAVQFIDVSAVEPRPTLGYQLTKTGWVEPLPPPPPPPPSQEELDAQVAREADEAFLASAMETLRNGGSLTQDERDRLMVLQLSRA